MCKKFAEAMVWVFTASVLWLLVVLPVSFFYHNYSSHRLEEQHAIRAMARGDEARTTAREQRDDRGKLLTSSAQPDDRPLKADDADAASFEDRRREEVKTFFDRQRRGIA